MRCQHDVTVCARVSGRGVAAGGAGRGGVRRQHDVTVPVSRAAAGVAAGGAPRVGAKLTSRSVQVCRAGLVGEFLVNI